MDAQIQKEIIRGRPFKYKGYIRTVYNDGTVWDLMPRPEETEFFESLQEGEYYPEQKYDASTIDAKLYMPDLQNGDM